jgi:ankyrin repeat protein
MCENATRKIIWEDSNKFNIMPVFLRDTKIRQLNERVAIDIRLVHITDSTDYQIFDAFKQGNISFVLDIIDSHKGVNAVDEWGQTALIIAVNNNNLEVISSLLNTRRPKVDINIAKSVSLFSN